MSSASNELIFMVEVAIKCSSPRAGLKLSIGNPFAVKVSSPPSRYSGLGKPVKAIGPSFIQ